MDMHLSRAQLLEHFLSFFMPEGILDFFELVWAESQSLDSRESKKDITTAHGKLQVSQKTGTGFPASV